MLLLAGIGAGIWTFIEIADEVGEGELRGIETQILLALRRDDDPSLLRGPGWFAEVVRDITALGSTGVLAVHTLFSVGYLLLSGKGRAAVGVAAAILSGWVLTYALKFGFSRPRPDLVPHAVEVVSPSFPSGHAMMSAVVYLTLGALLSRAHASQQRIRAYIILVAVCLTVLVGASRVFLGVHWPTDVLAGWLAGGIWATFCAYLFGVLQRRRRIEA
ncbi:MAG: phosphatase PAP2 family protein [Myxococcota bacterium]